METLRDKQITSIMRTISETNLLDAYLDFKEAGIQCTYKIHELYFPALHVSIDQQLNIRNIQ